MILFENSLIRLDYTPATDILEVRHPDLHDYLLAEIKYSIDILVDIAKSYDVKRLLLDSSRTVVDVTHAQSREVSVYLSKGIGSTRVQKVARLQSPVQAVEELAHQNIQHIQDTQQLPFQLQNFSCKEKGLEWLLAETHVFK